VEYCVKDEKESLYIKHVKDWHMEWEW
jgi:hypothetical protein